LFRRQLLIGGVILLAIAGGPERAQAATWHLELRGGPSFPDPDVQVREFDLAGTRLDLNDRPGLSILGAHAALFASGEFGRWRLRLGASFERQAGQGDSGAGFAFNGGVYPAGLGVRSTVLTTRLYLEGSARVAGTPEGPNLRVTGGLDHYHPVVTLAPARPIPLYDQKEDFLQFLPLPVLGVEGSMPLGGLWRGTAAIRGGTARNWNTHRVEGGTVRMDLTLVEGELTVRRPLRSKLDLLAGYEVDAASGTLTSGEDGNWIRSREQNLLLGLTWTP
jgi:hypothetical protein